jgi:glutathione S-transferase
MTRTTPQNGYYRFYASEVSYFSAKVRPALRYKGVPFVEILATPPTYREVIVPRTGLAMIPVVVTPEDETIQDSSDILDAIERRFPEPPLYPSTPLQRVVCYLVELYADEFLILPALHYRWSFPESEAKARADFAATTGDTTTANRFADMVKNATSAIGVQAATIPVIETHTRELLDLLSAHFAERPYVLGGRPSLADCALMGPLYAHLYVDAVPGRLLRERAPLVCHWVERMNHPDPAAFGDWLADDALPQTLRPLLSLLGRDAAPLVLDATHAVDAWIDGAGVDGELPRVVGVHDTTLGGVAFQRWTTPYTLWMVQRPLDVYRGLPPRARSLVDGALAGTGCETLLAHTPRHRVSRRPFKVHLDRG